MNKDINNMTTEERIEMGFNERVDRINSIATVIIKEALLQMMMGIGVVPGMDPKKDPEAYDDVLLKNFYGHVVDILYDCVEKNKVDGMDIPEIVESMMRILYNRKSYLTTPRDRENKLMSGLYHAVDTFEVSLMPFNEFMDYINGEDISDDEEVDALT